MLLNANKNHFYWLLLLFAVQVKINPTDDLLRATKYSGTIFTANFQYKRQWV